MKPLNRLNKTLSILAKDNKDSILQAYRIVSGQRARKYKKLAQRLESQQFAWGKGKKYMSKKHLRYSKALDRAEREQFNTQIARKVTAIFSTPILLTTLGFGMKRQNKKIKSDY